MGELLDGGATLSGINVLACAFIGQFEPYTHGLKCASKPI